MYLKKFQKKKLLPLGGVCIDGDRSVGGWAWLTRTRVGNGVTFE